jgi:hypothetical protein
MNSLVDSEGEEEVKSSSTPQIRYCRDLTFLQFSEKPHSQSYSHFELTQEFVQWRKLHSQICYQKQKQLLNILADVSWVRWLTGQKEN